MGEQQQNKLLIAYHNAVLSDTLNYKPIPEVRLLATTAKLRSFVLFKITEHKIFLPKFCTSEYAEQLLGHIQFITHELLGKRKHSKSAEAESLPWTS